MSVFGLPRNQILIDRFGKFVPHGRQSTGLALSAPTVLNHLRPRSIHPQPSTGDPRQRLERAPYPTLPRPLLFTEAAAAATLLPRLKRLGQRPSASCQRSWPRDRAGSSNPRGVAWTTSAQLVSRPDPIATHPSQTLLASAELVSPVPELGEQYVLQGTVVGPVRGEAPGGV